MEEGVVDAIILAGAGLLRLGHANRVREWISPRVLLPAIGQGALGLESGQMMKPREHWSAPFPMNRHICLSPLNGESCKV